METYTVTHRRIPSDDPRLARHVRHDSRNRLYAYRGSAAALQTVKHTRYAPIFNQGQVGSCTGNAALGCLGTGSFYLSVAKMGVDFSEPTAVKTYSKATALDGYPGQYLPTDTGSDGPAAASALREFGWISGYRHGFSLNDALAMGQQWPFIVGVNWYDTMYDPTTDGELKIGPAAKVAGGHEFVIDSYDATRGLVGMTNSWGTDWGVGGRAFMSVETFERLLKEDGDATLFTPVTSPPPQPQPVPVVGDAALVAAGNAWEKTVISRITAAGRFKTTFDNWKVSKGY